MKFLERGQLPDCDYKGAKLKLKRGQSLELSQRCSLVELRGDWKYIVEILGLKSHYNGRNVCHRCAATQKAGPLQFANFSEDAGWVSTLRSNRQFLQSCVDLLDEYVNPLLFMKDFHISNIKACFMHIGPLGIGLYTNGSAMMMMIMKGLLGPGTKKQQLAGLWKQFLAWRRRYKVGVSIPYFRAYCLHMGGSQDQVFYQSKAWHGRIISAFLAEVLIEKCKISDQDDDLKMTTNCLYHFAEMYSSVEAGGRYLSEAAPYTCSLQSVSNGFPTTPFQNLVAVANLCVCVCFWL